jgi:hypothetical protein
MEAGFPLCDLCVSVVQETLLTTETQRAQRRKVGNPNQSIIEGRTSDLQGSSSGCGYQDYRVKISYSDNSYFVVQSVEILERLPK